MNSKHIHTLRHNDDPVTHTHTYICITTIRFYVREKSRYSHTKLAFKHLHFYSFRQILKPCQHQNQTKRNTKTRKHPSNVAKQIQYQMYMMMMNASLIDTVYFRILGKCKKNTNRIHEIAYFENIFFCSLAIEIHSKHLISSPKHSKHNAEMASGIESIQSFCECQWPKNITMNYNWSNNIENKINTKYVGSERKAKRKKSDMKA